MKKRLTNIILTLALFGYLIFLGRSDYLIEWLAFNNFCYVWAVIVILWVLRLDKCAKWLTAGSILAVFPAQILQILNVAEGFANLGVYTWIALTALSLIIGISLEYRKWRKDHPKPEKVKKTKEPDTAEQEQND